MTSEVAVNNLAALLQSPELKLCKNDHIALEQSLIFLKEKIKEFELFNKTSELVQAKQ